ncbi:SDR family NAD(P)-dependent oxidoreductase [Streptomyces sp. NPDC003442]
MSVVVSGAGEGVAELVGVCAGRGWKTRQLAVSHAFHSALMEPMLEEFAGALDGMTFGSPRIPVVSTVTGEPLTEVDVRYWVDQVRRPVRFADAVAFVAEAGVRTFLEVGPDAALTPMVEHTVDDASVVPASRRDRDEVTTLIAALARLHANGVPIAWEKFFAGTGARRIDLPTYAFQRQWYWADPPASPKMGSATDPVDTALWETLGDADTASLAQRLGVEATALGEVLPALSEWRRSEAEQAVLGSWRYRVAWRPLKDLPSAPLTGTWLVMVPGVVERSGLAGAVTEVLAERGVDVVPVQVSGSDRAELAATLRERAAAATPAGVLSLLALDDREHDRYPVLTVGLADTVTLAQALQDAEVTAPLWCVTRDAVAAEPGREVVNARQAAVWGMASSMALDHPDTWGGVIDVRLDDDPGPDTEPAPAPLSVSVSRLCDVLAGSSGEDQVALRAGAAYGRRLVRAEPSGALAHGTRWRPAGTTLITGGTGGLGAHTARVLAAVGAEHLLLASRRGPRAEGAAELAAELEARGARVTIATCDVADRDALARLLDAVPPDAPLTTVVHAAGAGQRIAPLTDLDLGDFADAAHGKVLGATHLDELLRDRPPLDAFVVFSSGSAIWGSSGQAAYGSANAVLDAVAQRRRALGRPATALAWGPWDGGLVDAELAAILRRVGTPPMAPERAAEAFRQALADGAGELVVADFDWPRFAPTYTLARPRPLLNALPDAREALDAASGGTGADEGGAGAAAAAELAARLDGRPSAEQGRVLLDLVRTHVAALLGYDDPRTLDAARPFDDLGFDSVAAVDLRTRLCAATGRRLPSTMVFDYATPAALAEFLRAELSGDGNDAAGTAGVLAALDRIEESMTGLAPGEIEDAGVGARLNSLAAKVTEILGGTTGAPVGNRLETASAEDVFDFIDNELGIS